MAENAHPTKGSRLSRWNPVHLAHRSVRRFRRRSVGSQLRTLGIAGAVVAGLVVYIAAAPSVPTAATATPSSSTSTTTAQTAAATATLNHASTSTRGIVGNSINVVFPVVSLNSLAGKEGFASDVEFGEQKKAIEFFTGQVNSHGGINGKKINPIVVTFTPTDTAEMRSLCKDWTEGTPAAFAVLDGVGTWVGTNQLCVAQEGHTPLISQWTTVTNWTQKGAPYLWWTGPDDAPILQAVVNWGLSAGLLGGDRKVGVLVGDRASDQLALKQYLLPDLQRAGVTPVVETIAANPTETATTNTDAPLVVQKFKAAGVDSIIPLVPFNAFFPYVSAEQTQKYFPKLLLSDYENLITGALGIIPVPDETALNGQEGVTTETLGGFDDARPYSQGGYDPGVRACYTAWHKKYPELVGSTKVPYIEEQGPVQGWCIAINLFATAARDAGANLNRRTFVQAMAKIKTFPGGFSPVLSYSQSKYYGPVKYPVVELHNNVPPSSACKLKTNHKPQGTCWVVKQTWQPLPET